MASPAAHSLFTALLLAVGLGMGLPAAAAVGARAGAGDPAPLDAAAHFRAGDYTDAAAAFTARLEHMSPADEAGRGRVHFDLGATRLRLGQLAEAEYHLRRAVLLLSATQGERSAEAAAAREGLATVHIAQGNMIGAEEVLQLSLEARLALWGPGHPQVLRTLDLLATVHRLDGEPQRALELYTEVMSGLRAIHGNVHPLTATTAQNIGAVQMEISTDFAAELMLRQAVFITEALHGSGHPEMVAPLCGLGDIMTRAGMLDRAIVYYERALAAAAMPRRSGLDAVREHVRALTGLARARIEAGDTEAALPLLRDAVTRHDGMRAAAGGDMEAATIGGSPRPLLAHAYLLLDRPLEAWQVLEDGRGRLAATWRDAGGDSLRTSLLDLEGRIATAGTPLARRELEKQWLEGDARLAESAAASASGPGTSALAAARLALADDDLMIGWLEVPLSRGRQAGWMYALARGGNPRWHRLDNLTGSEGARLLQRYRDSIAHDSAWDSRWEALADSVWSHWFAPVAPQIDTAGRLLVVTAEPMGGVPLAPLGPRGGRPLLERADILAAPAARDFARPAARVANLRTRPALVVADPPYAGRQLAAATRSEPAMPSQAVLRSALGRHRAALESLPRLAASRDEATAIRAGFPVGPTLLGAAASEAQLAALQETGELSRLGLIHLATHALVDCRAPDRSALVLADLTNTAGARQDGLLTAREVRLGWRLDADLVTLSACETGLGRQTWDDGMLSLTAAFSAAGARNVVSSLWKVEDRATAMLMEYFYEELARTGAGAGSGADRDAATVPAALRAAQLRLRNHVTAAGTRPWAGPWAWGGFVAYGGAAR
ncbi:MAG: CHAT domain-containing protein [bacterium]|nr:CHAT domain-containing protein [bacterium]